MKLSEIINVRDDIVFGGAVHVDWFYQDKSKMIAENFVFHGPDFFGVTEGEVEFSDHKLMDTCSYTKLISEKLNSENGNPLMLTIAGYGTGKSHLAVTLGKLFENRDKKTVDKILTNIRNADRATYDDLITSGDKKNLVLILNGMKDFNLNIEILNSTRKVLSSYGYSEDFFSDITKAYTIAKIFIERNYELHQSLFNDEFTDISKSDDDLYEYILENIYTDTVFNAVNNVYEKVNGTKIRWDEGITASEILRKLDERLCGENGDFNKILILFDEFGRYIEFAADRPELAGDSALQQIYETIQDSNNGIILVGFIQSDLKTYMARVKKSSSIARYVGRYESGEKLYLSSNLETIFANLVNRADEHLYKEYVLANIQSTDTQLKYQDLFQNINKWSSYANSKGVWKDKKKFQDILVKGIYPMNPLSVLLLTSLSDWYQQRSALNFFMDSIKNIGDKAIEKLGLFPQIYATDVIKGDLFTELLLAEKEGRQRSENCLMFERILVKHGDKFFDKQEIILSAILVFKLLKLRVESKAELLKAFSSLSGVKENIITNLLDELENEIGVIVYDENRHIYDFVEDATGQNDFNAHFNRVRNRQEFITMESLITGEIRSKLGLLQDIQTDFAKINNIKTNEWSYKQEIRTVHEMDDSYFKLMRDNLLNSTQVKDKRGLLIYVYLSEGDSCDNIVKLYKKYKISKFPVILWLLDDSERIFFKTLLDDRIISSFSKEETEKYSRFIDKFRDTNEMDMKSIFKSLIARKEVINIDGIVNTNKRMKVLLKEKFEEIYPDIIPFPFEGFTNKQLSIPKKNLCLISKSMISGSIDYSWIQVQDKGMRNIVSNVFVYPNVGWGVLNDNYDMQYPSNRNLYKLFSAFDKKFEELEELYLEEMYNKCVASPIGMNDYSFALLVSVYLRLKGIEAKISYKGKVIKNTQWSMLFYKDKTVDLKVLSDSKIIKVNIEGYLKKYQILCNEIEHESNISRFSSLAEKLDNLELENDPPEELTEKVQACHMRLETGLNQLKEFNLKIMNIQGEFNRGVEGSIDFKYILNALVKGKKLIESEREANGHFDIPNEALNKINTLYEKGRIIIDENYMTFLKKQNCMSVSNVGPYRKWLEHLAENLKELGYEIYATKTLEHMEITTESLENIRQVQESVEKCEAFLKVTKPSQYSTQEALLNDQKKANLLINLIDQNLTIDTITRDNYKNQLAKTLEVINGYLDKIKAQITEIYNRTYEIKTLSDAKEIKSLISDILEKGIRHEEKEYIEDIGRVLTSCITDITDIINNNTLAHRAKRVFDLKLKYDECNEDVDLNLMLDNYIKGIEDKIQTENKVWMENHNSVFDNSNKSWNAQKCQSYLADTEVIPDYLFDENKVILQKNRQNIFTRLKNLKIESVVELFKVLNEEEKSECIKQLKTFMK